MALTRNFLKSMNLTEDQIESVIEEHVATVNGLKDQIKQYKESADLLPNAQKELADAKSELESKRSELEAANAWKEKYEKEHKDFSEYKTTVDAEKKTATVKELYKALLADAKINEKQVDAILNITDFSKMEVGEDGKLVGSDEMAKTIAKDYDAFVVHTETKGNDSVENPPAETGKPGLTREKIMEIKDTTERQKAIAENLDLFVSASE